MSTPDLVGSGMTSPRTRLRLVERLREQGIRNEAVLAAIAEVPRHIFVDEALSSRAYEDTALPIGLGQTLSQPYIVARMTEIIVDSGPVDRVLEVGTGSGYQAAILSRVCGTVVSIERIGALLDKARERLRLLNARNVVTRRADGHGGLAARGPFNAIVVTAAPRTVPEALVEQLARGGRLLLPLGGEAQQLTLVTRDADGETTTSQVESANFVPLLPGVN